MAYTIEFLKTADEELAGLPKGVQRQIVTKIGRLAKDAIATIRGFTTGVCPKEVLRIIVDDDPDNRILECAVEAGADVVITGDHVLRQLGAFRNIRIQSPRQFLEEQKRQAGPGSDM